MPRLRVSDGVGHLVQHEKYYSVVSAIYSHLTTAAITADFIVARLTLTRMRGELLFDDGAKEEIGVWIIRHTDSPLVEIELHCRYSEKTWILSLPNEW